MSERTRNIVLAGGAILVMGIVARIFYGTSTPVVEVKAEELFYIFSRTPGEGLGFTNSMLILMVVDILLIVLALAATMNMQLVPRGLQNVMEAIIEGLYKLFSGINARYTAEVFPITATIFLLVLFSNWAGLLPGFATIGLCEYPMPGGEHHGGIEIELATIAPVDGMFGPASAFAAEEGESHYLGCEPGQFLVPFFRAPSADLNMTLALAIIAFITIEYFGFKTLGLGYLKKFFISPFGKLSEGKGPIMSLVGLLELISEFARLPAFMFRLFGNIFAGEVLLIVMIFLLPLGIPIPFYLFEVFVGFIQAFIFAVLTMAFISIAVTSHSEEHH